ncbi:MAG: CehA/McbA family metallohydrolase [Chloroflexota bacterium]
MHEYILNMHMHTVYSDGHGKHADIITAAKKADIDAVYVTDHNILVKGIEGYYSDDENPEQKVLMLIGEEIHDQARKPQKNHMLVLGAQRELATFAEKPQQLIDVAKSSGGLTFLAHPFDGSAPKFGEVDISWVDWGIKGFTGIEIWNGLSEFKSLLKSYLHAFFYAYNPKFIASGPPKESLAKWDELTTNGVKVVGIGGSDAHALPSRLGPFRRILFPYGFHFQTINTHVWTKNALVGQLAPDKSQILDALKNGHCYVGYDLPASTRGFRFTAHCSDGISWMGDEVSLESGVTLQIRLPQPAEIRLLRNGELLKSTEARDAFSYSASLPGVYRVEVYISYLGRKRGWIFSNPIYIR